MILIFLVSYIMKHLQHLIKAVGTYFSKKNFPEIPKNDHFLHFSVLPRHFQWLYLSHFWEIWNEKYFGSSKDVISAKEEKILCSMTFSYCFQVNELKNVVFWSDFCSLSPNFPMKPFKEGQKILCNGSCINQELPFQI